MRAEAQTKPHKSEPPKYMEDKGYLEMPAKKNKEDDGCPIVP